MRVEFVLNLFDSSETFAAPTSPLQSMDLAHQSSDEWLSQRSRRYKDCTTVTRVLHEGTELPKDKPLQLDRQSSHCWSGIQADSGEICD